MSTRGASSQGNRNVTFRDDTVVPESDDLAGGYRPQHFTDPVTGSHISIPQFDTPLGYNPDDFDSHYDDIMSQLINININLNEAQGNDEVDVDDDDVFPNDSRPRQGRGGSRVAVRTPCGASADPTPTPTPTPTPSPTNTLLATVGSEHPPAEKLLEAKPPAQKPKKLKIKVPFPPLEINEKTDTLAVRKCMHCEITKTPQWRAGPMGPKTLCNACGVRYKSGRLFPEYRPAASPTFVPSLHSNSHKKVVQMRSNVVVEPTTFKKDSVFVGNKPPGGGYISK